MNLELIEEKLKDTVNSINLYKININGIINAIPFTNIIFYDNQNKTLPEGQDLSTNILVDITKLNLSLTGKTKFKIVEAENPKDDFSDISIKTINVFEFDAEVKNQNENKIKND